MRAPSRSICSCVFVGAAFVSGAGAQPASQTLEMWGAQSPPPGTVTSLDMQGVQVMLGDGTSVLLGWDVVRDVKGPRGEQFDALRDDARAVWRAGVRLGRGDLINAEPLLEDLFGRYGAHAGSTSSFVARGLLRCRLERGARAPAVDAWLGALRAERWTPEREGSLAEDEFIDPGTGLAPRIAPVWLPDEHSEWLARQGGRSSPEADASQSVVRDRLRAFETLFRVSAAFEAGGGDRERAMGMLSSVYEQLDVEALREPGLALVHEMVLSRVGDAEQRVSARSALASRLGRRPAPWREAWIRVAIGRSLILEEDAEQRRRGVLQLLHLPARLDAASPTLSSIALAHAAVTLRELGDSRGASTLRRELLDRYPGSEGARWRPIVDWGAREIGARTGPLHQHPPGRWPAQSEGNERS